MRLAADRPVKIILLGAGGTGGYVIPHLYRIAFTSNRPCRVIIADGDIVERNNLIRQNFAELKMGGKVLSKPIARVYPDILTDILTAI